MKDSQNEKKYENSSDIKTDRYRLVLINDDINSFDYVIECLVNICKFDYEKAEQCTLLTHLKGQYPVLSGDKGVLESLQEQLNKKSINTKIVKNNS